MQADTVYKRGGSTGYPELEPAEFAAPPQRDPMLFPPRFGFDHPVPGILDVLALNRLYPDRSSATSGAGMPGYSGSSGPSMGWW